MLQTLLILSYRVAAILAVITPIIINITFKGDILTSLLYAPLTSLALAVIFIYFDRQLVTTLNVYARFLRKRNSAKIKQMRAYPMVKNILVNFEHKLCPWC